MCVDDAGSTSLMSNSYYTGRLRHKIGKKRLKNKGMRLKDRYKVRTVSVRNRYVQLLILYDGNDELMALLSGC